MGRGTRDREKAGEPAAFWNGAFNNNQRGSAYCKCSGEPERPGLSSFPSPSPSPTPSLCLTLPLCLCLPLPALFIDGTLCALFIKHTPRRRVASCHCTACVQLRLYGLVSGTLARWSLYINLSLAFSEPPPPSLCQPTLLPLSSPSQCAALEHMQTFV